MARLQDKVIIVTGSSSGFGRGIAKACAAESTYIHGDLIKVDGGETLCR